MFQLSPGSTGERGASHTLRTCEHESWGSSGDKIERNIETWNTARFKNIVTYMNIEGPPWVAGVQAGVGPCGGRSKPPSASRCIGLGIETWFARQPAGDLEGRRVGSWSTSLMENALHGVTSELASPTPGTCVEVLCRVAVAWV